MRQTVFKIPKMDCPSDENLIRLMLENFASIKNIKFDLPTRQMIVIHNGSFEEILTKLKPLQLKAEVLDTKEIDGPQEFLIKSDDSINRKEKEVLQWVFAINGVMFLAEFIAGWLAESTGLLADSLDMFADAAVFALSLYAVGKAIHFKKRAARFSGYLQMTLAVAAFIQVVHRFIYGSEPKAHLMMLTAAIALMANMVCMYMLSEHRKGEVHMQASWIFLSNDVIANALVILAGFLVQTIHSPVPDLVVGTIIASVVFIGSMKILRVTRT